MGLLGKVLASPVLGPASGLLGIARAVAAQVDRELYDEEAIRGQLHELDLRRVLGEIDEAAYEAAEEALLARLRAAQKRKGGRG